MPDNTQVRLARRPTGLPGPECWAVTTEPVPEPAEGGIVVRVSHVSLDPAMRGWMNAGRSYIEPVEVGDVMRAGGVGVVTASRSEHWAAGDLAAGSFGVQEYAGSDGRGLVKIDPDLAPPATWLGALGMAGMTAYFGLLDVGSLRGGDVVVVSGAAGAVGSLVGQIAKLRGASSVVGIAGGPAKCAWLTDDLGFDAAIDYRAEDVSRGLARHVAGGMDVYFDNVGGEILDTCLTRLRLHARVVICGAISQYNATGRPQGPANYLSLLVNRARMEGFVVFDFARRYGEAAAELAGWLREGRLIAREEVVPGAVTDFPEVLLRLFRGENTGKLILALTG